ncbi:MAG: hypothetical protein ACREGR_01835 [Minisyncoccia bacterium]
MPAEKYIYRLKQRAAWLVKQKPFQTKSFSDAKYGGKLKAKQAAIKWRDRRAPNVPHPPMHATNSLNTSGKVGVSKYLSTSTGRHLGWIAFWWEGGRQINVRFTFKRHGKSAHQKAVRCRLQAEERLAI